MLPGIDCAQPLGGSLGLLGPFRVPSVGEAGLGDGLDGSVQRSAASGALWPPEQVATWSEVVHSCPAPPPSGGGCEAGPWVVFDVSILGQVRGPEVPR
eukprot:6639786-Alexandrium_andersonii.AAC.1